MAGLHHEVTEVKRKEKVTDLSSAIIVFTQCTCVIHDRHQVLPDYLFNVYIQRNVQSVENLGPAWVCMSILLHVSNFINNGFYVCSLQKKCHLQINTGN